MAHTPVLLKETVAFLAVRKGGRYVDGTLGRAGHAKAVVALGGEVLGIDRDDSALEEVGRECIRGLHAVKGRHGDLLEIAKEFGWNEVDGIMLDLGVSSPQLDEAGRGFSFMREGPLDMRMDASGGMTAADLVNGLGEGDLARIFRTLGEEPRAAAIAREIVRERSRGVKFETTLQLADAVEKVSPRRSGTRPCWRSGRRRGRRWTTGVPSRCCARASPRRFPWGGRSAAAARCCRSAHTRRRSFP